MEEYIEKCPGLDYILEFMTFNGMEDGVDFYDIAGNFICTIDDMRTQPYPKANRQPFIMINGKKKNVDIGDLILKFKDGSRDVISKELFLKLFNN